MHVIVRHVGVDRIFPARGGCTSFLPQKLMTFFGHRSQYTLPTVVQQGFKKWQEILYLFYCCFQQCKNFQNRLAVDEVIAESSTPLFSETQCTGYPPELTTRIFPHP